MFCINQCIPLCMQSSWLVCVHTIMNALFHPRNELKQPEHKQGRPSSLWFPSKHTYLTEFVLYTYSFLRFLIQDSPAGDADPAIDSSETIPVCTQQKNYTRPVHSIRQDSFFQTLGQTFSDHNSKHTYPLFQCK